MLQPTQLITKGQRTPTWGKSNIDYYIECANFGANDYSELMTLYRAAEGNLTKSDYNYILNPFNVEDEKLKRFPSKLRNYDIIGPIVKLFMGERTKYPDTDQVLSLNADAESKFREALSAKVNSILQQTAINEMNAAGVNTGLPSKNVPPLQKAVEDFKTSYVDERAIVGQEALTVIKQELDLDEKTQQMYYHWLVTGRVVSYRGVTYDSLLYRAIKPYDFSCIFSEHSPFVEDGSACVARYRFTLAEILDNFRDKLSTKDLQKLEAIYNRGIGSIDPNTVMLTDETFENLNVSKTDTSMLRGGTIDAFHVVWKTGKKVGILKYQNELGEIVEKPVDESYVLDTNLGDISIEWEFDNEVVEGWKLAEDIYLPVEPIVAQRNDMSNNSVCKLPYNGRYDSAESGSILSIVRSGLVYQALYNIFHYKRELTVNRNKDKLMLFPIGLIPTKQWGKDAADKFMYLAEATSILWYDETAPNAGAALQALKSVDMGLYQYIDGMNKILIDVKNEWWDAVGMNRQRFGDTQSSDGKGVNEQAIFRSAVMTAEGFRKFNKFRNKDMNGLLDYSKYAWMNGKQSSYITSDRRLAFFNVNPLEYTEMNHGVYSTDADEEAQNLKDLKAAGFAMSQKGTVKSGTVAEIIDARNFPKVKELLKKVDELEAQRVAQEEELNRISAEKIAENNRITAEKAAEVRKYVADKGYEATVDAAKIQAAAKLDVAMIPDGEEPGELPQDNTVDILKLNQEDRHHSQDLSFEKEKLAKEAELKKEEIGVKRIAARKRPSGSK